MKMKIKNILKIVYLIIMCTFLPLYMKQGYFELGEAKGVAYIIISTAFLPILLVLDILKNKRTVQVKEDAATMILIAGLLFNVFTLIFSVDKAVSFWGQNGWRCGFLTVVLMLISCYLFQRDNVINNYVIAAVLITPFFSFVLGIFNRFSIYPFDIYGSNASFIGTLGNINWFTGYISVFLPIGIAIGYFQKWKTQGFFACNVYNLVGLIALFLIGSESGLLIIIGTYGILLYMSLSSRSGFRAFLMQVVVLGIAMELVALLMVFCGNNYNYEDNLLITICRSQLGLIFAAAALFVYRVSRLLEEISVPWNRRVYRVIVGITVVAGIIVVVTMAFRGAFNGEFGNGRGIIWAISIDMFKSLSPSQKLFGVGQDCFYSYAYNNSEWTQSLLNVFDGNFLTNAHSEPLTTLIERGISGVICYYGLIGVTVFKIIKDYGKYKDINKEHTALVCALPIVSYFFNSLVSFSTVTSTPYLFILLGIAIGVSQNQESE